MNVFCQLIGFGTLIAMGLSYWQNDKRTILQWQVVANLIFAIHYTLLQLPTDTRFAELADAVSREIARRRIPAEQERQLAVLLHHLISGAPLSEAMERQAAEFGIHLECPHILLWIRADAPELQRRSWLHEVEERCRALGADMWGALSEDGFLLALEADDLFALEMPLWQEMADFAAVHGVICAV